MKIKSHTCPNCSAPLPTQKVDGAYICSYCDSRIWLIKTEQPAGTSGNDSAQADGTDGEKSAQVKKRNPRLDVTNENMDVLACCVSEKLAENKELKVIVNKLYELLEENNSSADILPMVYKILEGKKEAATPTSMTEDYAKVQNKLAKTLTEGENLIMFKTAAFFNMNKLKTGMFLTDKRVGYIDGRKVYDVEYKNLTSILIDIGLLESTYWFPNEIEDIFISSLGITNEELGVILAYVIFRAGEETANNHIVTLKMKENT